MQTQTMIMVYFITSCLVGQLTFFISIFTSLRKEIILLGMVVMFISQREFHSLFHLRSPNASSVFDGIIIYIH